MYLWQSPICFVDFWKLSHKELLERLGKVVALIIFVTGPFKLRRQPWPWATLKPDKSILFSSSPSSSSSSLSKLALEAILDSVCNSWMALQRHQSCQCHQFIKESWKWAQSWNARIREDIITKSTFSFGHCFWRKNSKPLAVMGRGGTPLCRDFFSVNFLAGRLPWWGEGRGTPITAKSRDWGFWTLPLLKNHIICMFFGYHQN